MDSNSSFTKLLPLYIVIFVGFIGYSLMITVFTPMILHAETAMVAAKSSLSYRTILLGFLLFIYPFGQFLGSPILGALSDRFGRKSILLISLAITTLCYGLIAFSILKENLILLIIILFIAGLCEGNIVIAQSAISDIVTIEKRNQFFGYIYLSASLAYIVGPLIGGKLAAWFNYSTPFWLVFVLLISIIIWLLVNFSETRPTELHQKISYSKAFTNLLTIFTNRKLRILYFINFLIYLAIFGFFRCFPMYLVDEFHFGVGKVAEFIAWVGVPIVLANAGLTGFLSKRYSVKTLAINSAILTGVFMVIVVIPRSQQILWLTLFLTALALAICLPSVATFLSMAAPSNEMGRVMGNNQALQVGAEALSGLAGGLLAAISIKLSLLILGIMAILGGIFLALDIKKVKTS
jgi:DHA1 family tetracycline resistance protein-like MFS transporter